MGLPECIHANDEHGNAEKDVAEELWGDENSSAGHLLSKDGEQGDRSG
jgi:hypothetical protein